METVAKLNNELAKRAVACKHWRWMPGMLIDDGTRLSVPLPDRMLSTLDVMPDLTDPATLGCLLALVREAWNDPHLYVGRRIVGWGVCRPMHGCAHRRDTEVDALVAALEAAP